MNNQLVSIVIPTYNQPEYILRAVESALMQDYEHLEVLVSDDSTTDETHKILLPFIEENKIKYFHNNPRLGRVENYRKCLYDYAQGYWVLNLDGDDYLTDKEFISRAVAAIDNDNEVAFVIAGGTIKLADGTEIQKRIPGTKFPFRKVSGKIYFRNFAKGRGFFHLTILYNAQKARSIDFYRLNMLSTDLESFLRLSLNGKVVLLDRNVGVWFHHNNNTSSNADIHEIINNVNWIDSVSRYAISEKKIAPIYAFLWNYMVKEQELTGMFIHKLKTESDIIKQMIFLKFILKYHPRTFFFPVFLKKLFEYCVLKN